MPSPPKKPPTGPRPAPPPAEDGPADELPSDSTDFVAEHTIADDAFSARGPAATAGTLLGSSPLLGESKPVVRKGGDPLAQTGAAPPPPSRPSIPPKQPT